MVSNLYASTDFASWTSSLLEKNVLADETDYFQLGQVDDFKFERISFGHEERSVYQQFPTK